MFCMNSMPFLKPQIIMKFHLKTITILMAVNIVLFSCSKEENLDTTPAITIPDANFKQALLDNDLINTNGDSKITELEAESFTGNIAASDAEIESVEGLEYFTNATRIALFSNELTTIDLSKNTEVTQLLLEHNNLTSIDISMLSKLVDFKGHTNALRSANIANGNNANMTRMEIQNNSDLICIEVDSGELTYEGWIKDETAIYCRED